MIAATSEWIGLIETTTFGASAAAVPTNSPESKREAARGRKAACPPLSKRLYATPEGAFHWRETVRHCCLICAVEADGVSLLRREGLHGLFVALHEGEHFASVAGRMYRVHQGGLGVCFRPMMLGAALFTIPHRRMDVPNVVP